jgi:hypothetical protein
MPALKTYDLLISHAWKYNDEYHRLVSMLNTASLFHWRNYSVPKHDPKIDPDSYAGRKILLAGLTNQIKPVNCFLILSGMYTHYSYWINREIEIAQKYRKPIIGIRPRGQLIIPKVIQEAALEITGWNTDSIVSAIRRNSI